MMIPSLTETSIPSLIQWIIGTSIVIAVVISNQGFKEEHKANKNSLLVLKKFLWNYYLKQFNKEEQDIIIGDQAGGSGNNRHRYQIDKGSINTDIIRHDERVHRKNEFLQSILNDGYGYKSSKRGHIDTWRYEEFPTLLRPINAQSHVLEKKQDSSKDENVQLQEVYLDYAGSSIPSLSLLNHTHQLSMEYQILANPHSSGVAASRSMEMIEKVKMKVQTFFGAEAGPLFGFDDDDTNNDTPDYHPGYDIIFTSGATEALRIVGEHFQWTGDSDRSCCQKGVNRASNSSCCDSSKQSIFLYPPNVHTSVIGIREFALAAGATFRCKERSSFDSVDDNIFQQSCCEHSTEEFNNKNNTINHLLALPLECNFDGSKIDAKAIIKASRCDKCSAGKEKNPNTNHQWFTILDIAKAASTQSINLREIDPDFACVSFYKIFGHPTGMGALFVKRTSMHAILPIKNNQLGEKKTRTYFGGGAVDIVLPRTDFVSPRSNSSILSSFIHGTMNFRNAVSLFAGFDEIESLGGMKEINVHTKCLAIEAVKQLKRLQHENGVDVIKLYGPWSCFEIDNLSLANFYKLPGPTIAFNVIRQDGSFVGYNEVTKLAALYQNPIQLRTGCFCNPGACQDALALSDDEVKDNFLRGGHVCGDEIDIVDGIPTGAVRTSFGRDSIWEDLDSLVSFLKRTFISHKDSKSEKITKILLQEEATLSEIYVYPIKSCGGKEQFRLKKNNAKFINSYFAFIYLNY
jgi:molybdenum cofactor sulfurtransferase